MPSPAQLFAPVWPALPFVGPLAAFPPVSTAEVGPSWYQLRQHWRPTAELGLNPGWARIRWNDTGLLYEAVLLQQRPANRARRLYERTWELWGICESRIHIRRPAWCRVSHLARTPLPKVPRTLGEHVHAKRKELGLRQWQLALILGVCHSAPGNWEANHCEPQRRVRERVVAWLGFDPRMTGPTTQKLNSRFRTAGNHKPPIFERSCHSQSFSGADCAPTDSFAASCIDRAAIPVPSALR